VNDDLDQLLKNLKLRRMREILDAELERAEKKKPSYSEFIARVLREEYQHQQERFLEYRIDRANLPERWSLETFPWKLQPGVNKAQIEQLAELEFVPRAANPSPLAKNDPPLLSNSDPARSRVYIGGGASHGLGRRNAKRRAAQQGRHGVLVVSHVVWARSAVGGSQ